MALVVKDRVQETTTTSGTGTLTLLGAIPGFQTFSTAIGNGNTTFYTIYDNTAQVWEVGVGTVGAGTLVRTTVLSNSSGTTSPISLAGNASSVFCTYPAEKSVNQDANGTVNILTNVPNTTTNVGTLNVGDGTYNFAQLGQLATFASNEPVVNTVSVQNTSTSNTAYSSIQLGADNYNTGYFLELGTNSSTYSYAAAGYPNSSINQPNTNYILANKADLGIATWDADDIHFIQNASVATTDSMTLFASGGVSLGGYGDPGIGTLYANNVYLGFTLITAAAGTTILTNASAAWQQVVGTTTQSIQLPDATTLFKGFAFTVTSSSTGVVTIKDNASATIDTVVTGGSAILVLIDNSTTAGTWKAYSYVPSSYDFSATIANFGTATINNALWNGTTIATGYGGTGLTSFGSANYALYSTSSSALTAGTLPVAAGGTGATTLTGYVYGNGTGAFTASTTIPTSALTGNYVSTFSGGSTGLTPNTATTGAVTLAGTLATTNGGTGLTSFTSGGALYATSTSALTTGTLPIASGGTGQTTANTALNALLPSQSTNSGKYLTTNGTDSSWATVTQTTFSAGTTGFTPNTPTSGTVTLAGTLNIANGGTGQTTASAAFNALSPITSTGDLILGNGTNSATRLGIGTNGYLLTSNGTTASWQANTSGPQANGVIYENSLVISSNYTLTTGKSGMSVGPITINSGVSVTVPSGQRWVVL
jgi:hypothetical protein